MKLPEKLGVAGSTVSLMGIAFGWGIFPWLLKKEIGKIKGLAPGSESRSFWEKVPFPIDFRIWVFNVTNYRDVHEKGEFPYVEEVGPYQYIEWKEKGDVIDYEEDDTATFYMKNTWIFNKEKTAPLTGDETVFIPHPILTGMVMEAEKNKPGVLGLVEKAITILFNKPETIFLKTTVNDLLFGGIILNCTTKDFAASAICAVAKKESNDLEHISPTISKFAVLKLKNGTNDPNKFQVNRGVLDPAKIGQVLKINGKKKLPNWRGKPCNDLEGTDSTVFAPVLNPTDDIVSFNIELCRSIPAKYVGPSSYKQLSSYRYNVSFGDMSTDPTLKCLCYNDTMCLKKGIMDMAKCTGSPVLASLPHFYDAHEDYLKTVRGLRPNENDHSIFLDIEPRTGTPLQAKKRVMFSFPIHKVNHINVTQNLPDSVLPFLWVEESVELPDNLIDKLNRELFLIIGIVDVVKWLLTVLGAAIMSGGVGLYYKRQNSIPITPTSTANRKLGSSNDFLADKKNQHTELHGHTNLGYI